MRNWPLRRPRTADRDITSGKSPFRGARGKRTTNLGFCRFAFCIAFVLLY
ncbi:MAG: hypothetical protein BLITH_0659 [Brockia lithotrophica]|uniref:Uncharacterized protein n=1 Tax=Brockia lithotrophica TaxID=933949 RepID=A0A2T5G8H6_9BACL|nr:MAG: hypothetical protein BLITH_0659 [Brockia lithotrophica]